MKKTFHIFSILLITIQCVAFSQLNNTENLDFGFTTFNTGQVFTTIAVDYTNKRVWAGTSQNGVFNIDVGSEQIAFLFSNFNGSDPNGPDLSALRINSMVSDELGNIWIAHSGTNFSETQGGIDQINGNLTVKHYIPDRNALGFTFLKRDGVGTRDIKSITIDMNNTVWAAQKSSNIISGSTFILTPGTISSKKENEELFISKSTWWNPATGTTGNISPELPYPAYTFNPEITVTPQSRNIQAISTDSTEVWVGSWAYTYLNEADQEVSLPQRILRYDLNGTYIPSGSAGNGGLGYTFEDMKIPPGGVINNIYRNNNKGSWVTTSFTNKGFSVFKDGEWIYMDPAVDSIQRIIPPNTRFNDNAIWGNTYGNVFIGTTNGLLVYDGRGPATSISSYTLYSKTNIIPGSPFVIIDSQMASNNILGGASEQEDTQWIATDNGIIRVNLGFVSTGQCPLVSRLNGSDKTKLNDLCNGVDLSNPRSVGNEHINFVEDQLDTRDTTDPTFHNFIVKTVICSPTGTNGNLCTVENIYEMFKKNSAFQAIIPKDLPDEVLGDDFLRELIKPENKHLIDELLAKTNNATEPIREINEHIKGTGLEDFIIFGVENRGGMNILGSLITDAPDQRNTVEFYTNQQIEENKKDPIDGDQSVNGEEYRLYNVQQGIDTRDIFVKNYPNDPLIPDIINAGIREEEDCIGIGLESIYYDPIIMFVDDKNYKMVNYTKEGHIFYPGKIVRTIKRDDTTGEVYVETEGIGFHFCSGEVGQLVAATNALVGPIVFKNVDFRLKKAFEELAPNN